MAHENREYVETHPWITFQLDLNRLEASTWLLLGEATSKCEHIGNSMLKPEVGQKLLQLFLAKGVHATTAIEGNTLSEEDALGVIQGTLELPQSQSYLAQEIENIVAAANEIKDDLILEGRSARLSKDRIEHYNKIVLQDLPLDEEVVPGVIRNYSVGVGRYRGAPHEDCEYLLARLCEWLDSSGFNVQDPALRLPYAVIKAAIAHLYMAWIHPFGDGNGRTARLMEVQILLAAQVPTAAAHLLSNHYNLTRSEYYRQLDQASRTGDPIPFISYAIQGFVDGLKYALEKINTQHFADRWEQYVYETFGELRTGSDRRRLRLVLDLSEHWQRTRKPVPKMDLQRLSTRLVEAYATKTDKTLTRDLNAVVKLGLVELKEGGFAPRDWVILTFRPQRRVEQRN